MKEKRDCDECGLYKATDIHHKDRNRKNNKSCNIKYLCKRCHGREHGFEGQTYTEDRKSIGDAYGVITSKSNIGMRISAGFEILQDEET